MWTYVGPVHLNLSVFLTLNAVVTSHINTTRATTDRCVRNGLQYDRNAFVYSLPRFTFTSRHDRELICFPSFARTLTVGSLPPRHPLCGDPVPEIGIDDIRYAPNRYPEGKSTTGRIGKEEG